jgi:hypothetical protein
MENEIVAGLDGEYALCFFNDKAYSEKKVWEIFGRYGHVSSVRYTIREERQLVFVRYKEHNEAERCLVGLSKTNELVVKVAYPSRKFASDVPYQQTRTYVTRLFRTAF